MKQGANMDNNDNGFVEYHVPCSSCGSSDARSINANGSSYCFSCQSYFPAENGDYINKNERGENMQVAERQADITHISDKVNELYQNANASFMSIKDRGISEETCKKYGVKASMNNGMIGTHIYPYHDETGSLIGMKTRYVKNKQFSIVGSTSNSGLFGQQLFNGGKYVTITEGEVDALSVYQMLGSKYPVVSIKNGVSSALKDIKKSYDWLDKFESIVLNFDNDEVGREASKKVAELFQPGKVKIVKLPESYKDANDMAVRRKYEEYTKCWWNAPVHAPDGIIKGTQLLDEVLKPIVKSSINYGWKGLDELTYGIRSGELVTITAGTGLGKTSVIKELVYHIFKSTESNIGMIMLEESPKITALDIMGTEANLPLRRPDVNLSDEDKTNYFNKTVGTGRFYFYNHFGSNSVDNIVSRVRYMAKALDCKFIVLDHISMIVSSQEFGEERKALDEIMTKLRTLVQETDVALICVSHLKRPDGKGHEEGAVTSLAQLRGSGSIAQLSDMVLGLERDSQSEDIVMRNTTCLRVLKNRFVGMTGPATYLYYDKDTGRLHETDKPSPEDKEEDKF
jgi:twinkle protein|tara:strand:- start:2317 stop:4026 length:1710 start_codon:yes stop_codon:yes gene_type:complete